MGGVMADRMVAFEAGGAPLPCRRPAPDDAEQGDVGRGRAPEPIRARTDFSALALFAASVPTDAEGRARVPVKLPDSLTRYRVMAVAASRAAQLRVRRGDARGAAAAHGPPVRPALPELRRPLRAAGRGAEPDRRRDDGGRRGAGPQRRAHRRGRPPPRGGRERPRGGALPHGRGARRDGRGSRWAPRPAPPRTRPRSSCRSGRRPRPRPSPRTGRSTTGASCSP